MRVATIQAVVQPNKIILQLRSNTGLILIVKLILFLIVIMSEKLLAVEEINNIQ